MSVSSFAPEPEHADHGLVYLQLVRSGDIVADLTAHEALTLADELREHALFAGAVLPTDPEFEFAVEITGEPSSRPDASPNFALHFVCPHCLAVDSIRLRDESIRWNGLTPPEIQEMDDFSREVLGDDFEPRVTLLSGVTEADKDFENDTYFCLECRHFLTAPDYFDITWS